MIDLIFAAMLLQAGDPCHAVPQGSTHRSCAPLRALSRDARFETFEYPASILRSGRAGLRRPRLTGAGPADGILPALRLPHLFDFAGFLTAIRPGRLRGSR